MVIKAITALFTCAVILENSVFLRFFRVFSLFFDTKVFLLSKMTSLILEMFSFYPSILY